MKPGEQRIRSDKRLVSALLFKYRGPMLAGAVLFAATWLWASLRWNSVFVAQRVEVIRHARALASTIEVVVERLEADGEGDDARLHEVVASRLKVAPPIRYAILLRGPEWLAVIGEAPASVAPHPGLHEHGELLVVRMPLVPGAPPETGLPREVLDEHAPHAPPGGADDARNPVGPPWRWVPDPPRFRAGARAPGLQLLVGLETRPTPHTLWKQGTQIATLLFLAWAAIGALVYAWARSIFSRELAAALDAERRERKRLGEMSLAAAGLAHEIKNPLGIILGLAQGLSKGAQCDKASRKAAEQIIDAADQATARLGDFINFARLPPPRLAVVPAPALLGRVAAALGPEFEEAGVRLVHESDELSVRCDPGMLEQVLVNLLLNSLQASGTGTRTTVRLRGNGARAALSVTDQGKGIAPELLPDVFKPYVTGRADGHGLGLAIVERIASQHGWKLGVRSAPGEGTNITISELEVATEAEQSR